MTGRDLIMYILSNNLEDEPIFKNGAFIGFVTLDEAAVKMGVGIQTIKVWIHQGRLKHVKIGDTYLILSDCKLSPVTQNYYISTTIKRKE